MRWRAAGPDQFLVSGKRVFCTADDGVVGRELWVMPAFVDSLPDAALRHLPARFPGLPKYPGVDIESFSLANELFDEAASLRRTALYTQVLPVLLAQPLSGLGRRTPRL